MSFFDAKRYLCILVSIMCLSTQSHHGNGLLKHLRKIVNLYNNFEP